MGPKKWALDIAGDIIKSWPNVGEVLNKYDLAYIIMDSVAERGMSLDEGAHSAATD